MESLGNNFVFISQISLLTTWLTFLMMFLNLFPISPIKYGVITDRNEMKAES